MKTKILYILLFFTGITFSQNVNIPDAVFKAELVANTAIDLNNDNEIQVSEAKDYAGSINVADLNISDLTGIEAFVNITGLFCNSTNITSLDLSANTNLHEIDCSNTTSLVSLNIANGNNTNFTNMNAVNNPNLACIQVDNDWELVTYEDITYNDVVAEDVNLNNTTLVVVENNVHIIGVNEVILYKTTNGNYGKLEILNINDSDKFRLTMRAVTYDNDGTVLSQTPDTGITVREGFHCKLSPTIMENVTSTDDDFKWQIKSGGIDFVPVNTALFKLHEINDNYWNKDATTSYDANCPSLSVKDVAFSKAISLFPNPVSNELTVVANNKAIKDITLYNVMGNKVMVTNSSVFNVSNLATGIYYLKVKSTDGLAATKKFIKQ